MRILVSGDSHCDVNHLSAIKANMERLECDKVFIVGDFGFWPRDKAGRKFLERVADLPFPVYFLKGNHEDHTILDMHEEYPNSSWRGEVQEEPPFIEVSRNCFYAPSGSTWEWDGVKFGAMGGAYSIDRHLRTAFVDWFPQEMITLDDVEHMLTPVYEGNNQINWFPRVDVFLSHDAPIEVDMSEHIQYPLHGLSFDIPGTVQNRTMLSHAINALRPKHIIHGHWHVEYNQKYSFEGLQPSGPRFEAIVQGLNCNGTGGWRTVIDTEGGGYE